MRPPSPTASLSSRRTAPSSRPLPPLASAPRSSPLPRRAPARSSSSSRRNPSSHQSPPPSSAPQLRIEAPGWTAGYGTGGRVWSSSGVLCSYLAANRALVEGASVVELGSGTGKAGLGAAALGAARVCLSDTTDAPSLLRLARDNAARNVRGGAIDASVTTIDVVGYKWGAGPPPAAMAAAAPFDLIIASDCTYSVGAHGPLCDAINALLALGRRADAARGECTVVLGHQHRTLSALLNGRGFGARGWGRDPHLDLLEATAASKGLRATELVTERLAWHGLRDVTLLELTPLDGVR